LVAPVDWENPAWFQPTIGYPEGYAFSVFSAGDGSIFSSSYEEDAAHPKRYEAHPVSGLRNCRKIIFPSHFFVSSD